MKCLGVAYDEGIAGSSADRGIEHHLHARALTGLRRVAVERHQARNAVRRAKMDVQMRAARQVSAVHAST
jgi:hypothetical protein